MSETKKEEQQAKSIDERLDSMENESIKFPNAGVVASTQESKPVVVEEKKAETASVQNTQPTVSQTMTPKVNKQAIAFIAGIIIGALLVALL